MFHLIALLICQAYHGKVKSTIGDLLRVPLQTVGRCTLFSNLLTKMLRYSKYHAVQHIFFIQHLQTLFFTLASFHLPPARSHAIKLRATMQMASPELDSVLLVTRFLVLEVVYS